MPTVGVNMSSKTRSRRRIRKLVNFIEALDGFRIGIVSNIDQLSILYRELELSGKTRRWKEIKKDLEEIAIRGLKIPKIKKLMDRDKKIDKYYKYVLFAFLGLTLLLFLGFVSQLTIYLMILVLTALNMLLVYRLYLYDKINYLYYSHRDRFKEQAERLKKDIEALFKEVRKEARKGGIDLATIKIKLYQVDYSGIKVVGKPGRFNRQYTVILK